MRIRTSYSRADLARRIAEVCSVEDEYAQVLARVAADEGSVTFVTETFMQSNAVPGECVPVTFRWTVQRFPKPTVGGYGYTLTRE